MKARILIADDDPTVTLSLSLLMKEAGYEVLIAHSPKEALELVEARAPDAVIQDMNFSRKTTGEEGLAMMAQIQAQRTDLPIILLTAWGSIDLAVKCVKAGAFDFVTKPWQNDRILAVLRTALSLNSLPETGLLSRTQLDQRFDLVDIVGEHPSMLKVLATVGRVATTDASVLILGESGTGKELVAQAVHHNSKRSKGPFIKVNLGGIASALFESEMFGHVKGAFTDAKQTRQGRFALAHGGSIFLDEIGDLDLAGQVKMLRVLQERRFEPLGSDTSQNVDFRLIAATNRNLKHMVRDGQFREDLLYRLNLITIRLPPLRERASDIALLANHFLQQILRSYDMAPGSLTRNAVTFLENLPWPGNIRQLRQCVERAVLMSGKSALVKEDFIHFDLERDEPYINSNELPAVGRMTLEEMEKAMILKGLDHFANNLTKVAGSLGLSRAALYRRLEKYGIEP